MFRKRTDPPPKPVAEVPRQAQASPQVPRIEGSTVDIGAVYDYGQVTAEECDRVRRASHLLASLPTHVPIGHRKQVVDATLNAFGVSEEKIVDAAAKQLEALEGFIRASQGQTQRLLDQGNQRIAQLEAEIRSCRQLQEAAKGEQEARARTLNAEMVRVQQVLKFFADANELTAEVDEVEAVDPEELPTAVPAKLPQMEKPKAANERAKS